MLQTLSHLRHSPSLRLGGLLFAGVVLGVSSGWLTDDSPPGTSNMPVSHADRLAIVEVPTQRNQGFHALLTAHGVTQTDARAATEALMPYARPDRLPEGQLLTLKLDAGQQPAIARQIRLDYAPTQDLVITRTPGGRYNANTFSLGVKRDVMHVQGVIGHSLYDSGSEAGIPHPIMQKLLKLAGTRLDLQRDIRPGDQFTVLYARERNERGKLVAYGELIHAALTTQQGQAYHFTRFVEPDGSAHYYDEEGRSIARATLRTPVDGTRLSAGLTANAALLPSSLNGLDFAAPVGTAVYAAAEGIIIHVEHKTTRGTRIFIRHKDSSLTSSYSQLSGVAGGLREGIRVRQGQVIGFVGHLKNSPAPHLHYSLWEGDAAQPLAHYGATPAYRLKETALASYRQQQREVHQMLAFVPVQDIAALSK